MSVSTLEATTPTEHPVACSASTADDLDHALDIYLSERKRLFRIAYQILGDVAGAEDVLQEVWLRWQLTYRPKVECPAAYLTTTTTNLALNVVQSARHRHETPTEPHLIKPDDRAAQDPSLCAEQTGAIEDALALLMSRLTPDGLAAYVLRKAFGYAYAELARLLRVSGPNARVLVSRAQGRLTSARVRPVPLESHRRLVLAFRTAAGTGDLEVLTRLLASHTAYCGA
ncbi:RNA polymerase subunit sigma-70 [Streptomyces spinosirectus]|uniref:sigma factor n=1 Tax=Streptomyces TaxID=1883 RepID=UPI001C9D8AA4|nr:MULTISPECIES: sigma factor [Streptomyces]MBY8343780.1 RNA polymerase subunit sigma-70 [Streptomyces plumbidurans]UIR22478.1 RNA polymerase subunit sigma-70 [Streptomyces spinosirectus]